MIREKIQTELHHRQISISELSRITGIRRATLSDYLNGHYEMRLHHVENVLKILNLTITKA